MVSSLLVSRFFFYVIPTSVSAFSLLLSVTTLSYLFACFLLLLLLGRRSLRQEPR